MILRGILAVLKVIGRILAVAGRALWRLFRKLPGKAQIVVAIVLVLLVAFAVKSCADSGASSEAGKDAAAGAQSQEQAAEGEQTSDQTLTDYEMIDRTLLSDYLNEEELDSLIASAEKNEDVAWIASHISAYSDFGYEVQEKLLKLVAREPESVDFVRNYPEKAGSTDVQPCDPVESGTVPQLIQWDTRWAYPDYSRFVIGLSGCGPTSMCMIYQGLTGESDKSPYDFATDAIVNDFVHNGTDAGFYSWEAENHGLTYEEIGVDADELKAQLKKGHLVLCNVGPGDFTEVGHFIVITAVDDQGKLTINDPNSKVRSAKKWDINRVVNQTQAMMCFGKSA